MEYKKTVKIIGLVISLILGGFLIKGGIGKFSKSTPTSIAVVEKVQKFKDPAQAQTLQKILYINGMQQTGYLWQFLGVMQIICGILLISQIFTLFGAIMAFPIVINIFLFHLFLEPEELGELLLTLSLLILNLLLLFSEKEKLKTIIYQPEKLKFNS